MRWLILLIFALNFFPIEASNNSGVVRGVVFDVETSEPLPGATIIIDKNRHLSTNDKGYYSLNLTEGEVIIAFRFIGYKSVSKTLYLNANDTIILDVGLEPQVTEIDQIVISAGRVEQRLSELTVSLSIIEPKGLESNHITDASELLNRTSGVEILDGQASIRSGSGYSYGAGSRVLMLVDGLPILSPDAGHVKWHFLPLENISQMEIIKGASSVMYGSSALNGVINIRTADAPENPETKAYVETGVFGKPNNKNWVWWDTPRLFTSASFSRQKRFHNTHISVGSTILMDNGYRKFNDEKLGRANLRVKHYDSYYKGLSYGFSINAGVTQKKDFVLWQDAEKGALKQSESTAITLNSSQFTFDPFVSISSKDKHSHDIRLRLQSSQNIFPEAENNNSDAFNIYAEYQAWYKLFQVMSLNAGLSQNYRQIISPFYGDHTGSNIAGYTQLNITPAKRLRFVGGMRIEHNSLNGTGDKLVPLFRAGVNFRLLDYTFLRASYGQGYRYPSIAEKHAATTLGAVRIFPNTFLQPEYGWNSEVGFKQAIEIKDISGLVDLAFFYSQNKDLIEYVFGIYPDGMGFRATNIEYSRVYGFEVELNFSKDIGELRNTISSGYVFTYPIEFDPSTGLDTDTYLKFRRKHSGNFSIASTYQDFDFGLSMNARSKILNIDDVFLNPVTREDILPGFYDYWLENNTGHIVFDLSIGYNLNSTFSLSLVVKNVANTEYMGRPGDIMPHRNFSLRLSGFF